MSFSELIKGKKKVKSWTTTHMMLEEIIDSDVLEDTTKRLILKYVQTGYGARNYCLDYGNTGAAQFFQYYLAGRYDYSDVIPTVTIGGAGTPLRIIQSILNEVYGEEIEILEYYTTAFARNYIIAPSSLTIAQQTSIDTIIRSALCAQYDYDYLSNTLYYNNLTYEYVHTDQNSISGTTPSYSGSSETINNKLYWYLNQIRIKRKTTNDTILIPINAPLRFDISDSNLGTTAPVFWSWSITMPYYYVPFRIPSTGRTQLFLYPPLADSPYWGVRYPDLDLNSWDSRDEIGYAKQYNSFESYPIVALRENKVDVNSLKTGNATQVARYDETVAMLNNLGIDLETVTDAYLEPSIDNVQAQTSSGGSTTVNTVLKDVFLQLGVSPATNAEVVSQCLFDFFENIYKELPSSSYSFFYPYTLRIEEGNLDTYYEWIPRQKIVQNRTGVPVGTYSHECILLPNESKTETITTKVGAFYNYFYLNIGIGSNPINTNVQLGVFLLEAEPPGMYWIINLRNGSGQSRKLSFDFAGINYTFNNSQVQNFIDTSKTSQGVGTSTAFNSGTLDATLKISVDKVYRLVLHRQISETQEEIIYVDNLRSWSGVLAGQTRVENLLINDDGEPNPNFLIPLSVNLIESMSLMQRTDLLSHCVHLCFYIYQNYTLKYKEGGILKKLLQVLSIVFTVVIAIIAPIAGALMSGTLGTITAAAITNALTSLFTNFLIGMALSIALKVIMKSSGSETIKYILSAVAMVVAIYVGGGFDGVFDSLSNTLKTAADLIEIPLKITEIYSNNSIQESLAALESLQNQATAFHDQYSEYYEQYSDILKTFDTSISTEYLVGLQRMDTYTGTDINPWILSPSAFIYSAVQSQFAIDSLFANDVETFASRALSIGILDT